MTPFLELSRYITHRQPALQSPAGLHSPPEKKHPLPERDRLVDRVTHAVTRRRQARLWTIFELAAFLKSHEEMR